MSAATCQAQIGTGATVSWASAEGGITWDLADSATDTSTPIAVPTAAGTNFSWIKNLVLSVTVAGTTSISNRRISMATSPATGLLLHWKAVAVGSYAQAASGNRPTASGSNGAVPAGYTQMTTSPAQYDNTSVATSSTGPNGSMAVCVLGVDNTYTGGAGTAVAIPTINFQYDEA